MNDVATRIRASRLLLEMLVVVASILIAFSLDAWWNQRAETRTEMAHLRALRSDFEQNAFRLEELVQREERIADASGRLLLLAVSPNSPSADDPVRNLLGQVFTSSRFDPVMGAYEAVVSSGGLAQVRAREGGTCARSDASSARILIYEEVGQGIDSGEDQRVDQAVLVQSYAS